MSTDPAATVSTELTFNDALQSVNGFDEIAIAERFGGKDIWEQESEITTARMLIFVLKRREGLKDTEAWKAAMSIPVKDLGGHFATEEPEVDEDEPETEQGKDASGAVTEPPSALPSASAPESSPPSTTP